MPWKRNKSELAREFRDLEFLPRGRSAWDCTLACLAYGMRMDIAGGAPDLNAWAARHGVAPSAAYEDYGDRALVLWHGTSRDRAEKIRQHGLFHKRGLWAARHPGIPHAFCRDRAEQFGTAGAVVCIVLDQDQVVEGRDFQRETDNVLRFHHGLPPEVVEYILVREEIRFTGARRAANPKPWPKARFKQSSGRWIPVQRPPVRFSESQSFRTLEEHVGLCLARMLEELGSASPLEVLSVLYSLVEPWDCLRHGEVIDMLSEAAPRRRRRGKWHLFLPGRMVGATR